MHFPPLLFVFLGLPALAQVPAYVPAAKAWDSRQGNHRAVVQVPIIGTVRTHLEWRRRDLEPQKKAVWVFDPDGKRVGQVEAFDVSNVSGEVVFQAAKAGEYSLYFFPVKLGGGAFPNSKYDEPSPADPVWSAKVGIGSGKWKNLPEAKVLRWEARTAFDAFTEMEIIATASETEALRGRFRDRPFVTFLEDREHSVRMFDRLPFRWVEGMGANQLAAQPNEYLIFQIPVWAHGAELKNVVVTCEGFTGPGGRALPASVFQCFNLGGYSDTGQPITRRVDVPAGRVQPLWCGLDLPRDLAPGDYTGSCLVKAEGLPAVSQSVRFRVAGPVLQDRGDSDPQKLTKLRWLNSTLGNDDTVTTPYTPVTLTGNVLRFLGREVELGPDGLPRRITSHYNTGNTAIVDTATEILSAPMRFVVEKEDGTPVALTPSGFRFTTQTPASAEWDSTFRGEGLAATLHGRAEYDGALFFEVSLRGSLDVRDIRLECPRAAGSTRYAIGLGREAGLNTSGWEWKWDLAKNQDSVWLGAVNAGLRLQLKDDTYVRPGVNIHYKRRPLNPPTAWINSGKGGVRFGDNTLAAFTGGRKLTEDKPLRFDFDLLVTPFHPLYTADQWKDRYYHTNGWPTDLQQPIRFAKENGANVVNIHQGNGVNPYINYPFLTVDKLKAVTDFAHKEGVRVKFYYTVRELSNWTPELFAARSMGDELLMQGKGGGHPWLEEHLGGNYWGAWYEPRAYDASLLTAPTGRWNNFYIEGLRWLVENAGCDGLYLDDISYDRTAMRRARKVLEKSNPRGGLIDLHSWNEFHAGGAYAQCANLFMDSLPFVDRLWFGEGHHYTGPSAEHFLVEISGVPYGLMGEMLENGGNFWFGLNHGMTGRLGWQGDPRPVWKLWDDFGVKDSEFIGWWDTASPIRTNDDQVKATFYRRKDRVLLSLANYRASTRQVKLEMDWARLGLDPAKAVFYYPEIKGQQSQAVHRPGDVIRLAGHKGAAIWIDEIARENIAPPAPTETVLGPVLWEETFGNQTFARWTRHESPKAKGSLKADGGLVVLAPANVTSYLETPLPDNAGAVRASVWQDGQDEANSWGPGLALVSGGKAVKFGLRMDGRFHMGLPSGEKLLGGKAQEGPAVLTLVWDSKEIRLIASGPAMVDSEEEIIRVPRSTLPPGPLSLRVGKTSATGAANDFGSAGAVGFNRIEWVRVYGLIYK